MTGTDEQRAREAVRARLAEAAQADYAVVGELGRGGMGWVFLGRDVRLGRHAALKVLPPLDALRPASVERFHREAETAARLSHPNIVPIYGAGGDAATPYFAMAYIEGESLAERLMREGRLELGEAVRIAREVGGALAYAHRQGVIHRDIKPHNVLLERDSGRALVADFGIARATAGERMTRSGVAVGTPGYMAPEQAAGVSDPDARVDQFALGVLCYEMLTGRRFEDVETGEWPVSATAVRREARRLRPDLDPKVADVIARAAAPRRDDRWPDVEAFLAALQDATGLSGGAGLPPAVGRRAWLGWYAAAALAVAGLGALAWLQLARRGARPTAGGGGIALMTFEGDAAAADSLLPVLGYELAGFQTARVADRRVFAPPRGANPQAPDVLERARRAGASWILWGLIATRGGQREISVRVVEAATGDLVELGRVPAPAMDLAAADSVVLLLARSRLGREVGLSATGAAAPASLEAVRAFGEAEEAFRTADYEGAVRGYDRVAALDTGFALAPYKRFLALIQTEPTEPRLREAVAVVRRVVPRVPPRERRLLSAYRTLFDSGRVREAELQLRQLVREDSTFLDGWFALGEVRYHFGALAGLPADSASAAFHRALALWTDAAPALMHLIALDVWLDRETEAQAHIARYLTLDSVSPVARTIALGRLTLFGSLAERNAVRRRLGTLDERVLEFGAITGATVARDRADLAAARQAFAELARPGRSERVRRIGANFALATLLMEGRFTEFGRELARYRAELPGDPDLPRWGARAAELGFGGSAPRALRTNAEVAQAERALAVVSPSAVPFRAFASAWPERYLLALDRLARGDTTAAVELFEAQDFLASVADGVVRGPVWLVRGRIAAARGDRNRAERYLRRSYELLRYAEAPWAAVRDSARLELERLGVRLP